VLETVTMPLLDTLCLVSSIVPGTVIVSRRRRLLRSQTDTSC